MFLWTTVHIIQNDNNGNLHNSDLHPVPNLQRNWCASGEQMRSLGDPLRCHVDAEISASATQFLLLTPNSTQLNELFFFT